MLWTQFAPYHVDRIEAVALQLQGRAEVIAVEVATTSDTYQWEPSSRIAGAAKLTLFPNRNYDRISALRRWWAQFGALWRCQMVLIGVGYNKPDIIALSWMLRLCGVQVVMMTDSKFDDRRRSVFREALKAALLTCYSAALVAGMRQIEYVRFLGFKRRQVLPGYDTVAIERIRQQAGSEARPGHEARDFVFVGRFVPKKNLMTMLDGYAAYAARAGSSARRLRLVGSGPLEAELRSRCAALGVDQRVIFTGFLDAPQIAATLSSALALILVSSEEQWGLVVNEALALGLPIVTSTAVGSRDSLVRNLRNGFIVEPGSVEGIAAALEALASDPQLWAAMCRHSQDRAWLADSGRFADAVELLFDPGSEVVAARHERFMAELRSSSLT